MTAQSLSAQTGSVKPHVRGLKSLLTYRAFRRISQTFFLAFIAFFAIQHVITGRIVALSPRPPKPSAPLVGWKRFINIQSQETVALPCRNNAPGCA